jgi:hypothetical protein
MISFYAYVIESQLERTLLGKLLKDKDAQYLCFIRKLLVVAYKKEAPKRS